MYFKFVISSQNLNLNFNLFLYNHIYCDLIKDFRLLSLKIFFYSNSLTVISEFFTFLSIKSNFRRKICLIALFPNIYSIILVRQNPRSGSFTYICHT